MTRRHVAVSRRLVGSGATRRRRAAPRTRRGFRRGGWIRVLVAVVLALLGAVASPASARAVAPPDLDHVSVSAHTTADPGHVRDIADEATRDVRRGPPAPFAARELPNERHHLHHSHDAALVGDVLALLSPAGRRTGAPAADADPSPRRFALPTGRAPPSPRAPDRP
ncbi:hypothetical protein OG948_54580 (plasmid) [Embleya sp. NBC_00888]|uniref:hypothetical protein n=1 Tax=Embleya sp. NBC_00888 TaxID=2975960 RepID=UPI002F9195F4|nr:hypothetical protein OG948_54580 [Embleya sp. NBC_00888]